MPCGNLDYSNDNDIFVFCYVCDNNQADIIEVINSPLSYLDDLLNIDKPYFKQMVGQIYPTELQLNKSNSFDTESKKKGNYQELIQSIPHLTQDYINGKVTTSQLNITNKSQEVIINQNMKYRIVLT